MWSYNYSPEAELYHFGIPGMHWGVRRYQNADGSLTSAGRGRYDNGSSGPSRTSRRISQLNKQSRALTRTANKQRDYFTKAYKKTGDKQYKEVAKQRYDKYMSKAKKAQEKSIYLKNGEHLTEKQKQTLKKAAKVGAAALTVYAGYKLGQVAKDKNAASVKRQAGIDYVKTMRQIDNMLKGGAYNNGGNKSAEQQANEARDYYKRAINEAATEKANINGARAAYKMAKEGYAAYKKKRAYTVNVG